MRELIHYGTLHDTIFPPPIDTPQVRIAMAQYDTLLRGVFVSLAEELVQEHRRRPFHRIYMESICEILELGERDFAVTIPARTLMKEGINLEPTEHRALDLLMSLTGGKVLELQERIKSLRKEEFLALFDPGHPYRAIFEEFFQDGDYADIHTARELWISRRIAASLREGERAIIFLGLCRRLKNS